MPNSKSAQTRKRSRLIWLGFAISLLVICALVIRFQYIKFKNKLNGLSFELSPVQVVEYKREEHETDLEKVHYEKATLTAKLSKPTGNQQESYRCDTSDFALEQQTQWQQQIEALDSDFQPHHIVINDDVSVTLYAKNLTAEFVKELQARLFYVYELYGSHFHSSAVRKLNLKMIMLPDQASYDTFGSMFIDNYVPGTSQGLFFHGSDSAFIKYQNEQQAMETILHEAIHALNFHLIGVMPRAINEGLAELFSSMVKSGTNQVTIDFDETNEQLKQVVDFQTIVNSEHQWDANDTSRYYMSGKLWLTFFFMEEKGLQLLRALLREEQKETCQLLEEDEVLALVIDFYLNYEVDFKQWLNRHFLSEQG